MDSLELRELQKSFFAFVAGPVESATGPAGTLARVAVRGDDVLGADARLGIYRRMCLARLVDVLRADYQAAADELGDDFDALARRYVVEHPSEMPSIQHISDGFPAFLVRELVDRPDVAERTHVDRARLEVFSEVDPTPLSLEELKQTDPLEWGRVPLRPIAALRVVTRAWAVGNGGPRVAPGVTRVWRQGFEIFEASADPLEAQGLDLLMEGGTTLAALGAFFQENLDEEEAAREAAGLLLRWLADGILHSDAVQYPG